MDGMSELIERLAREAGLDVQLGMDESQTGSGLYFGGWVGQMTSFAALVAEECAKECDEERRIRSDAGKTHPEESESRSRCFAGARAASNCAAAIREKFKMP